MFLKNFSIRNDDRIDCFSQVCLAKLRNFKSKWQDKEIQVLIRPSSGFVYLSFGIFNRTQIYDHPAWVVINQEAVLLIAAL
jgi:hypothetical protein